MRRPLLIVLLAVVVASCSTAHARVPLDDAGATLKAASIRSGATSLVTLRGAMTYRGADQAVLTGEIDVKDRAVAITLAPASGLGSYPPYEVRFVDGWSYVEIDSVVHRPPTVRADAAWIAYQKKPAFLRVPDRALPPEFPLALLGLPLTDHSISAHFVDPAGTNPRRVAVQVGSGEYADASYTYAVDLSGRIVSISDVNPSDSEGSRFVFTYGTGVANVLAPSVGVQRITPGENLYPTTTTVEQTSPCVTTGDRGRRAIARDEMSWYAFCERSGAGSGDGQAGVPCARYADAGSIRRSHPCSS